MLEEFFVNRDRRDASRVPRFLHTRARIVPNRPVHSLQRRHAFHASESVHMTAPQFSSLGGRGSPPNSLNPSTSAPALSFDSRKVAEQFNRLSQLEMEQVDLDEAWNACLTAVESQALPAVLPDHLLGVTEKIIRIVERQSETDPNLNALRDWGRRISGALQAMESCLGHSSFHDRRRHCLLARCASMMGDSDRALELLHIAQGIAVPNKQDFDCAYAYESIAYGLHRDRDAAHVLDFLVHEWNFIESLLYHRVNQLHLENPIGKSFRLALHHIFASVERPAELVSASKDCSRAHREKCGHILIELYCEMRRPMPALEVYHTLLGQGLYNPVGIKYILVLALTRADAFRAANKLYESISESNNRPNRHHLTTGLRLYSRQGDLVRAEQYFQDLVNRGWDTHDDKAMYMYAHAVQGDFDQAVALFNKHYPENANGSRLNSPDRFTLSMMIHGVARQGSLGQVNEWLQVMSKAGYEPDVYIYGSILKTFALRDDMTSIAAVLAQMRAARVTPNVVIYTTIMSVLARRGDVDGTEAIYKRAIRERIMPDRQMITTLMNAHVEAGSWEGVIRVFSSFKSAFSEHVHGHGTETYNTLLKAYVQIGAPYRLVLRVFNKTKSFHIEPDAYSYSLLIQSACDAGLINVATNIFRQMDRLLEADKLITVYCLTIIMGGFVRARNLPKAKTVLDEMIKRGIEPSSVSIGTLLQTYRMDTAGRNLEGLVLAEEFIKSLSPEDAKWNKACGDRKSALEHVYGPLLYAFSRADRPEDVERLYQDILDMGGRPTLGILSLLLDSYRRAQNPDMAQQVWSEIFQLGLEYSESSMLIDGVLTSDVPHLRIKDSILCIPLSIYIDAMSAAGRHAEVAEVWQEYKSRGFGFDSHNWNHLVIALVRSGNIEHSLEVVEKVIIPFWKQWQTPEDMLVKEIERMDNLDDLSSDERSDTSGDTANIVSEAERHRRARLKVAGSARKLARLNPEIATALFGGDDVVRPLRLLHHIAPNWNVWRPHGAVLRLLTMVMNRLDSGRLIDPITPDDSEDEWEDIIDPSIAFEKQRQARELLERIYQNYPQTVQMMTAYDTVVRRRLSEEEYNRRYSWTN
ncbi:hypothetical protein APHAL10511_001680 [Amanita phalloides]|nr:hypothetical protein APHAL10511_001680 [Amanita phalloides]